MDLVFDKVSFSPDEDVTGIAPKKGVLTITHLGKLIEVVPCEEQFNIGKFPKGGFAVIWDDGVVSIPSAFEVLSSPWERLRYGFVAEFSDAVEVENYQTWAKKLHLSAIQFYDWAWKHEFATTDLTHYDDPLGQEISTSKIKQLIDAYTAIGAIPCGYMAVYAVDLDGWSRWKASGLYDIDGVPYQLGDDFLRILDPADPVWLGHLIQEIRKAGAFGFPAFHLDQYGYPRIAARLDGSRVNLADQFPKMLEEIVKSIPDCKHIFNNVNDFPTWETAKVDQAATYIEVWDPHSNYGHLSYLVAKSREIDPGKPIILSAYLRPFGEISNELDLSKAIASFELTCASIASGGASHLLLGGDGRVLYHAYYVTNYLAAGETLKVFQNYYDFIVAAGDLLYDPSRVDVSRIDAFGVNTEIQFSSNAPISPEALAKNIWIRVFRGDTGITIHAINLLDQDSSVWNEGKNRIQEMASLTISIDAVGFAKRASIGRSIEGSVFESVQMTNVANRLELSLEIRGAWTVINIPFVDVD